jgi:hypothetical protein
MTRSKTNLARKPAGARPYPAAAPALRAEKLTK